MSVRSSERVATPDHVRIDLKRTPASCDATRGAPFRVRNSRSGTAYGVLVVAYTKRKSFCERNFSPLQRFSRVNAKRNRSAACHVESTNIDAELRTTWMTPIF